ncbi:MAG: thioesterase family protein [Lachnospiraceae bacterium]|nr:thioesterase family protein [Lachnospiraceae bacterium]
MNPGIKGKQELTVRERDTAKVYGSGSLEVFGTPAMIALMEKTALTSIEPFLEDGEGSVGTALDVKHTAATPVGMKVVCESELIEVDRKRLVFRVSARDEKGAIGEGTHERFVIANDRFMEKANAKRNA